MVSIATDSKHASRPLGSFSQERLGRRSLLRTALLTSKIVNFSSYPSSSLGTHFREALLRSITQNATVRPAKQRGCDKIGQSGSRPRIVENDGHKKHEKAPLSVSCFRLVE